MTSATTSSSAPTGQPKITRHSSDVLIIGAGGAGLRAAIAAREAGKTVTIVCKSLFGKAHTVMAEGGMAAAMGNVNSNDNWQVHFRDTIRGGKFTSDARMAEHHAKEAPMGVWELETYGALFDRTPDGKVNQRNFGGHEYPRLAHVGDRTGLGLIRSLQQKVTSLQQDDKKSTGDYYAGINVLMETTMTTLLMRDGKVCGAFGYERATGDFHAIFAPVVIIASGGVGKIYKVTSNSWESTGDGMAMALRAGVRLANMEYVQFHPTGMVWPLSVAGVLVTESVRGDGGVLLNAAGERFMFNYVPDVFKDQYATTEEEGDRWYTDPDNNKRPPELLPRDEVAKAINAEVKAGRGTSHGGVFLDIASRRSADYIRRRLPSMYHQFKQLADVDITKEPMEVGPTCHYIMGGIEVNADTHMTNVPGIIAIGEAAGGLHGSNRLGGNSLSDLNVFGKRAGEAAVAFVDAHEGALPEFSDAELHDLAQAAYEPFRHAGEGGYESAYDVHHALQQTMFDLVGIVRTETEMREALSKLDELDERAKKLKAEGPVAFNPGWHLCFDVRNMLLLARCIAASALQRTESRGGHTRSDYPGMNAEWRRKVLGSTLSNGVVTVQEQPAPVFPPELMALFDRSELENYLTVAEIDEAESLHVGPAPLDWEHK
ncbi:MAG: fumarate reductase/succinate dehydrogenase flavoprotein subunit [Nakamurella sp.]